MSRIVNARNDHDWVHRNYVCLLAKETDELYQSTIYFVVFLISLQIFTNVMESRGRVHVTNSIV